MSKIDKKICVVVPVYNSENTIKELVMKLKQTLSKFKDYSIVLINDNSVDKSHDIIMQLAKSDKKVISISLTENVGQQKATFLGLKYAKGDYIIIIDDDFAHDPEDIRLLYNEALKGYDVVYGIDKKIAQNHFSGISAQEYETLHLT